ncbi:MAG: hypothetical protein U0269_33155 [Polyangiales bacterium]
MSDLDTMMQVRAWSAGRAIATAEALPWPRASASSVMILAFVRMAGEATPWGFAIGAPGQEPQIVTVPDPRDQNASANLCVELSSALLEHVGHPVFASRGEPPTDAARMQLWVPGATHLDALHLLALRYNRARHGTREHITALRRLARAAGYLFRESRRPGQLRVFDASAKLRECFAFPGEPLRQQHLGYLLSWLRPTPDATNNERARREELAEIAERETISWTLDPELEERELEPLLTALDSAKKAQQPTDDLVDAIHSVLEPELARRWKLCEEAWRLLDRDDRPSNRFLEPLEVLARDEHQWQYANTEKKLVDVDESQDETGVFVIDPETDRSPAAASHRYWSSVRSADLAADLVHGDRWMLARLVADGAALEGTVRSVRAAKRGRATEIRWEIVCSSAIATKFREGSDVAMHSLPKRTATIVSIDEREDERVIVLEITGWKNERVAERVAAASDRGYERQRVAFVAPTLPELSLRKATQCWNSDGPGAWLTHARSKPAPARPTAPTDTGAAQALLALVERHR